MSIIIAILNSFSSYELGDTLMIQIHLTTPRVDLCRLPFIVQFFCLGWVRHFLLNEEVEEGKFFTVQYLFTCLAIMFDLWIVSTKL